LILGIANPAERTTQKAAKVVTNAVPAGNG
jgi:hypothetical protein